METTATAGLIAMRRDGSHSGDPYHPDHHLDSLSTLVLSTDPSIRGLTVRQLRYRPRRSLMVTWAVRPAVHAPGGTRITALVTGRVHAGVTEIAEHSDGRRVYTFEAAEDPGLPGLAGALDRRRLAELLAAAGVPRRAPVASLRIRAYRPLRRAVLEVTADDDRLFVKIVRPERSERLRRAHADLEAAGVPVPPVLAATDDGTVVLGAIRGQSLRALLTEGGAVPAPPHVVELLDALPARATALHTSVRPSRRVREHADWLAAVDTRFRYALELADRMAAADVVMADDPVVAVHGDLHGKNLFVEGREISGLVDLDGVGGGRRVDEYATFLGHLSVLDLHSPHRRAARLGAAWIRYLERTIAIDPAALRIHVAAVVLGLATGCYRVQEPNWYKHTHARLALAERWLVSAGDPGAEFVLRC